GEGFVFNTGGERVEGFTSLLWVMICAAGYVVSASSEFLLTAFLAILTSLTITMVYHEVRKDMQALHPAFADRYFFW
ncbi:hypothetical protein ACSNOK_36640, partial [Streptomyces sp. URMC 126]|uniref:hypothetical protein n=1 Tax=Streptomyces sp. URMC 126 TaxID=3423401 RepID=UPI003F1B1195